MEHWSRLKQAFAIAAIFGMTGRLAWMWLDELPRQPILESRRLHEREGIHVVVRLSDGKWLDITGATDHEPAARSTIEKRRAKFGYRLNGGEPADLNSTPVVFGFLIVACFGILVYPRLARRRPA